MDTLNTVIISVLTTFSTALVGIIVYWSKNKLQKKAESRKEVEVNKRAAFKLLLDRHAELVTKRHHNLRVEDWLGKYFDMCKDIILWGSDEILFEYSQYLSKKYKLKEVKDFEIHFANAIMAYRKELGFKNKNIQPELIVLIYRSGYDNEI